MSEGEKGERLDFEVCFCSGEDPDYPASELQREQSKGWQSPRFCEYPQVRVFFFSLQRTRTRTHIIKQEIGVRLLSPHLQLNQLQLLSHQSKISQRIELYIGDGTFFLFFFFTPEQQPPLLRSVLRFCLLDTSWIYVFG